MENRDLAKYIDHTLLKPQAGKKEVEKICFEAREHGFAAVCVLPYYVQLAKNLLQKTGVQVATVVGFPLGATYTSAKVNEVRRALKDGADEIDMVINFSALLDGDLEKVRSDITGVVEAAEGKPVKAIIETCFLNREQKIKATRVAQEAGAEFVKTSTGFGSGGATVEDVRLFRETLQGKAKIKASGGIRDREKALEMIEAGAHRLGTSSGLTIMEGK